LKPKKRIFYGGVFGIREENQRKKSFLFHDLMLPDVPLVNPDIDLSVGLYLGFETIAVFIKDQIHTALFMT
jgi:hypothetical protein